MWNVVLKRLKPMIYYNFKQCVKQCYYIVWSVRKKPRKQKHQRPLKKEQFFHQTVFYGSKKSKYVKEQEVEKLPSWIG